RSATRGVVAIAATNASFSAHAPSASCCFASSKAARAYGRATVNGCDMSDPGYQFVEQRLVRGRVDLATQDLLRAAQREAGDLAAQLLARAVRHAVDLGLRGCLEARRLEQRVLLGLVHDLAGLLVRAIHDRRGIVARLADFLLHARVR